MGTSSFFRMRRNGSKMQGARPEMARGVDLEKAYPPKSEVVQGAR